ncbi:unnamed protein product [Hydatigera taeniaeformis]|uniref:cyclin-dependent kinase n=1 Tax=Hydatigena taeniaeformis TaxID=6205 RepID=A0A0R3WKE6_HYDTA|nr:unnamed protein product [Hydatigera taeniaeformis]
MYQMLRALQYCHPRLIIHCNLKPQNVLVDGNGRGCKLADFGMTWTFGNPLRGLTREVKFFDLEAFGGAYLTVLLIMQVGNLWYCSPEILLGSVICGCGVDMWSLGCLLAEMVTGEVLFRGDCRIDQLFHIFRILGVPKEDTWSGVSVLPYYTPECFPSWYRNKLLFQEKIICSLDADGIDLLRALLLYDPLFRITSERAIMHSFFDDMGKNRTRASNARSFDPSAEETPPVLSEVVKVLLNVGRKELDVKGGDENPKDGSERTSVAEGDTTCDTTGCASGPGLSDSGHVGKERGRDGNGTQTAKPL